MSEVSGNSFVSWRRTRHGQDRRDIGLLGFGCVGGIALAYLVVHVSPAAAIALVMLPLAGWVVTRTNGGISLGLVLVLVFPYWLAVGSGSASVLRVASLAAAFTVVINGGFKLKLADYSLLLLAVIIILGWLLQYRQPGINHFVLSALTPVGFYLGARAVTPARIPRVLLVIVFAGSVGALTVLYELLRGSVVYADPTAYAWKATSSAIFRPGGIFGSPPGAATVLCFVILVGLGCLHVSRGRLRAILVICITVDVLALAATFTRAGFIAVGIGSVAFLWMVRSSLLRPLRVAWFAVAVLVTVLAVFPAVEGSATVQEGLVRPGDLSARAGLWQLALPDVASSPHTLIFGFGTGRIEAPFINASVAVPRQLASTPALFQNSAHSQYVTTLFEQGLVGLAALAVFLGLSCLPAIRRARAMVDPVLASLAASLIAVAVMATVDTIFDHGPSFAMTMAATGLAVSAMRASGENDSPPTIGLRDP